LVIKNIPLTSINNIQALVLYNRTGSGFGTRTIGLAIELYNYVNDPDLNEALANTNVITTNVSRYRYDFPSINTYLSGFVGEDSITNIVNDLTQEATVISFPIEITGNLFV